MHTLHRLSSTRRAPAYALTSLVLGTLLLVVSGCSRSPDDSDAPPADPTAGEATLAAAIERFRAQDLPAAAGILQVVTTREPENARAWALLGRAQLLQGELDGALAALERAVTLDETGYGAVYGLAGVHARRGEKESALVRLEQLEASGQYDLTQITLDPNFESLYDEPRFVALLPEASDFADPFVEEARILGEWVGEAASDEFGWIARNIGDVDGDGIADFVTSAPSKNLGGSNAGRIYIYSSRSGKLLWSHSGEPGERLGEGIEAAGDVDADGIPDVIAGAPGADRVTVHDGRSGRELLRLDGQQPEERMGGGVRGVGDVDGDGHGDLLVGAPANDEGGDDAGRLALYSGRDGSLLFEWIGAEGDRLGTSVTGAVSGAGMLLVAGAPDAGDGDRGEVRVWTALRGEPAFVISSHADGSELGGMFLSVIGDVDADGAPDVYASDWSWGAQGSSRGKIVVCSGRDGEELLALEGESDGDGFGIGPADAGDVDGDGHADLIVGAWQHKSAAPAGGKAYLFSGKDGGIIRTWTGKVMGDTFGFDATGMGDVDGDGKIDFLLTSAWSAIRGAKTGRVFLIAG